MKSFIGSFFLVSTSQVFAKGSGFVLLAILAREVSVTDYGLLTLMLTFASILFVVSDFGIDTYTIKELVQKKYSRNSILRKAFTGRFILTVIFCLIIGVISIAYTDGSSSYVYFVCALAIGSSLSSFSKFLRQPFYAINKFSVDAFGLSFERILFLFIGVYLTLSGMGVHSYAIALFVSGILSVCLCGYLYYREFSTVPFTWVNLKTVNYIWKAFPIGLNAMFVVLYFRAGQFFIEHYKGGYELGLYGAVSVFVFGFMTVTSTFIQVLFPRIVRMVGEENEISENIFFLNLFLLALITPFVTFLAFFSDVFIGVIFGEKFIDASPVLSVMIFQIVFLVVTPIYGSVLRARDRSFKMVKATGVGLLVNVSLCFLLVEEFGLIGVVVSVLLTEAVVCFLAGWSVVQKESVKSLLITSIVVIVGSKSAYEYTGSGDGFSVISILFLWCFLVLYLMIKRQKMHKLMKALT